MAKNKITATRWKEIEGAEEEIQEGSLRIALMDELVKVRRDKGISQKELEKLSGVSQPVITRMETGRTNPQVGTLLRLLLPLGKTLKIVEIE